MERWNYETETPHVHKLKIFISLLSSLAFHILQQTHFIFFCALDESVLNSLLIFSRPSAL